MACFTLVQSGVDTMAQCNTLQPTEHKQRAFYAAPVALRNRHSVLARIAAKLM